MRKDVFERRKLLVTTPIPIGVQKVQKLELFREPSNSDIGTFIQGPEGHGKSINVLGDRAYG